MHHDRQGSIVRPHFQPTAYTPGRQQFHISKKLQHFTQKGILVDTLFYKAMFEINKT
jgi:hypothetical protein